MACVETPFPSLLWLSVILGHTIIHEALSTAESFIEMKMRYPKTFLVAQFDDRLDQLPVAFSQSHHCKNTISLSGIALANHVFSIDVIQFLLQFRVFK